MICPIVLKTYGLINVNIAMIPGMSHISFLSVYLWTICMKLVRCFTFLSLNADKYVTKCVIIFKWSVIKIVQVKKDTFMSVKAHTQYSHLLVWKVTFSLQKVMNLTAYIVALFLFV